MKTDDALDSQNTIFEQIIRGEIPPGKGLIYEDAETMAFLTIAPNNPGHTLVIPKKHARDIFDVEEASLAAVMRTAQKVAIALKECGLAEGVNIIINNGSIAEQVVFHLHVHVIPRLSSDTFHLKDWPHAGYTDSEATEVTEKIRSQIS